jgi:hypothetical protein
MFATLVSDPTLDELIADRAEIDAREQSWLEKLHAYDRSGRWADDGFVNAAAALASRGRMDRGVARTHVEVARKLQRLERVRGALARGEISRQHASVITRAHTPEREAELKAFEEQLVEVARHVPPRALREVVETGHGRVGR